MKTFSSGQPPDSLPHSAADLFEAYSTSLTRRFPTLDREVLTPLTLGMMASGRPMIFDDDLAAMHVEREAMVKALDSGIYVYYVDPWGRRPWHDRPFHERLAEVFVSKVLANRIGTSLHEYETENRSWTAFHQHLQTLPSSPLLIRGSSYPLVYRSLKRDVRPSLAYHLLEFFDWQLPPVSSLSLP